MDALGAGFDPYEVLGVPTLATIEDIHRAYRAVARRDHPDANPGDPEAAARFARATAAYDLLRDDARRRGYDLARAAMRGPRPARSAPGPTGNTAVRGPDARPAHHPRPERPPRPPREPDDRPATDEFGVLKAFLRIAVVVVVALVILLVVAALNPAPECGPGVDASFCRSVTPSASRGGG
jgi:curved DNA-binding protein CbpA